MDHEYRRLLYRNSPISLLDAYVAIEAFILDTRLSFVDQYKLFDLLEKLLPNEENQLSCQSFLSWLVWRVDEHRQDTRTRTDKRLFNDAMRVQDELVNKRPKSSGTHFAAEPFNNTSVVHFTQQQLAHNMTISADIQQQMTCLQSIILCLASNIDALNHRSELHSTTPSPLESNVKHEQIEDNTPSEPETGDEHEDEASEVHQRSDVPVSTSTNLPYSIQSMRTKTIMYNGRNMMKHLRPRTTLTSFARHVASDLFSREEIMAKIHVDHNSERDILLRHCICTAWELSEQQLRAMWPKIRNALLQLRRDAIAGKCIRTDSKRRSQEQSHAPPLNLRHYHNITKLANMRLSWLLNASKGARQLLVNCESQATGHRVMRIRERTQDKLEFLHVDPWLDQEVLYKETRKIKTLEKQKVREIHLSRIT